MTQHCLVDPEKFFPELFQGTTIKHWRKYANFLVFYGLALAFGPMVAHPCTTIVDQKTDSERYFLCSTI